MITGSTHPQTPAEWLAKIDQATSMQDLDNVGAVSDDDHISCETVDSQTAKSPMKIMKPEFRTPVQLAEEIQEKKNLPILTRGQIAFMIHAFLKIKGVQRRVVGMDDFLNIELVNDKLKKFDDAWENIPVGTTDGTNDSPISTRRQRQYSSKKVAP